VGHGNLSMLPMSEKKESAVLWLGAGV